MHRSVVLYASGVLLLSGGIAHAETFDVITVVHSDAKSAEIRIDRPNPRNAATDYPAVTFRPGDAVSIRAGGCVQSGGTGPTWHRYVDPVGPNTDRFYRGLITIPFATGALDPIASWQGKVVRIPDTAPAAKLHLQLGFTDDNYGDNGYTGH